MTEDPTRPAIERATDVAIQARGLRKAYGPRDVLAGVDLEVRRGETVALLGPNGAGKTTTVEILEGYRRADAGEVRVLGADPASAARAWRARIGLMLQDGGLDPRVTPREALSLYAAFHRAPRDVDELLDLVGLRDVSGTRYRRLSGGERQRVGLALALVGRPEVLFLDEPTAGMDPAAKAATRALLQELRAAGTTTLLTTHDLRDVELLADRVAILDRGRIVAAGTPTHIAGGGRPRLRATFATPPDAAGLGAALGNRWPGATVSAAAATSGAAAGSIEIDGVPVDPAVIVAVAAWAAEQGLLIVELRSGAPSLEDRYLELTGDRAVAA